MFLCVFLDLFKDSNCSETKLEEEEEKKNVFSTMNPSYLYMDLKRKKLQTIM
jgi:hypothetical protein